MSGFDAMMWVVCLDRPSLGVARRKRISDGMFNGTGASWIASKVAGRQFIGIESQSPLL